MMPGLLKRMLAKSRRLTLADVTQLHGLHETTHLKRLFDHLGVDIIFDVGANAGQYATRLRRDCGYRGVIVSVEPIPEMIECLDKARRGDRYWHVEPVALAESAGTITFNVMNDLQCSSVLEPVSTDTVLFAQQTAVARKITVRSERLDNLMSKWLDPGKFSRPFLKLDTQGHDVAIVQSCHRIREFVGFQSELSVKRLYHGTPYFADALSSYCGLGFDVSALVPNNSIGFPQLIEIDCIMVRSDLVAGRENMNG
jgi:FkbM family methyltransferase